MLLEVRDLHASVEEKEILKGVNLQVNAGEVHAIMGPNGAGKSTLAQVIAGREDYEITQGKILLEGEDLTDMDVEERAREGVFLAFQYPVEIPGVTNKEFLRTAVNAIRAHRGLKELDLFEFSQMAHDTMAQLKMPKNMLERDVNVGFSGGEKKKNDIFQMAMLDPKLALLDETDSGLDIDALKVVAEGVNALRSADRGFVLVTHYQRLLEYIKPDVVHVFVDGRIVETGDFALVERLEKEGYDQWLQ